MWYAEAEPRQGKQSELAEAKPYLPKEKQIREEASDKFNYWN